MKRFDMNEVIKLVRFSIWHSVMLTFLPSPNPQYNSKDIEFSL